VWSLPRTCHRHARQAPILISLTISHGHFCVLVNMPQSHPSRPRNKLRQVTISCINVFVLFPPLFDQSPSWHKNCSVLQITNLLQITIKRSSVMISPKINCGDFRHYLNVKILSRPHKTTTGAYPKNFFTPQFEFTKKHTKVVNNFFYEENVLLISHKISAK
jgi:hypothetical protein